MPWDTDFLSDAVEGESPPEIVEAIGECIDDEGLGLEYVAVARRKLQNGSGSKPTAGFVKWANYTPDPDETAEEISAAIVGAAYAAAQADAANATNKYQATIVWTDRTTGKRARSRHAFELDAGRRHPRTPPATICPGCAAYRESVAQWRSQANTLQRDLIAARREAGQASETSATLIANERDKRDDLLSKERDKRDELARDIAKVGTAAAKDARDAYKPTQDSTAQIMSMLAAAVDSYRGAIEAHATQAEGLAAAKAKEQKGAMVADSIKMLEKLGSMVIRAKLGGNINDDSDDKSERKTPMERLLALRDKLFATATPNDWTCLRDHAGDDFVASIEQMREGEIDIAAIDEVLDKLARDTAPTEMMRMMVALSEPVQDVMMAIGDAVKAAKEAAT